MNKLEKILGHKYYMSIKQPIKKLRDDLYYLFHKKIQIQKKDIDINIFEMKKKHVFFGYYDIQQLNDREDKLLVHIVDKKAEACMDKAEIGYYNLKNNEYCKIGETQAWNWQQGARLRWWPNDNDYVIYNDAKKDSYICKKIDIKTNEVVNTYCRALYDIDPKTRYGLSLNFSRLQRLRPGYGYNYIKDRTIGSLAPDDDGIFYVNLITNKPELIISLRKLAKSCNDPNSDEHYINHISISPNGEKFMFFHIWTIKDSNKWKTRLYVSSRKGERLKILEEDDLVSHYDWIDDNHILVTGYTNDNKQTYSIYNVVTGEKEVLDSESLKLDGHPTTLKNKKCFITDTYPKKMDLQELFEYDSATNTKKPLLKIYSSPLLYEEKRCDLHPRVSKSERIITIDSTYKKNCKKIILIKTTIEKE